MGDPLEETTARQRAAQERAKRERAERLERALEELKQIRDAKTGAEAKAEARASETDPEARMMKVGNGGYAPSYNAQSAGQMRRRGVDEAFYPQAFEYDGQADRYRCPAGKILRRDGHEKRIGVIQHQYRASRADCAACSWKERCCPGNTTKGRAIRRAEESPAVRAFIEKMQTVAAKAVYRLRGAVAEFPNAWIKAKLGLRQFHVRGKVKALSECLWACITYNIQQWIRLRWRPAEIADAG
jgi:hypothetical protein